MNRISIWYSNLSQERRKQITAGAIIFAVIALAVIGIVLLVPKQVEVTYGTIVRDPYDGHIWEDESDYHTKMVSAKDAGKYQLKYIDKLSPEHQKQAEEEAAQKQAEEAAAAQSTGLQDVPVVLTGQQAQDIVTLQNNLKKVGPQVVTGFQMTNAIQESRNSLVTYRNQLANTPVPAQIENMKQQAIQVFDKLIQSCDLYISAIANVDLNAFNRANALINEAFSQMAALVPQWTQ
ncbi:MAG: hypothetical protein JW738_01735 [Actinobacteria bacterium]|nr:hypothetical protein [Actinomycetota bacterium]